MGISTEPKAARLVTARLATVPELRQLCSVSGEFDYLALLRAENTTRLDALLDLVALGTVADVVKLDANNRRLVAQGLRRIRAGQKIGRAHV